MNRDSRHEIKVMGKSFAACVTQLEGIYGLAQSLLYKEENSMANTPRKLIGSPSYKNMEVAVDRINEAIGDLEVVLDNLEVARKSITALQSL